MVKQNSEISSATGLRGRRAVQAEQTRLEILGAARRQFALHGYAATSVKDIATEAGVSVQTVYDSVGSKAELVRRLNDLIDAEAGVPLDCRSGHIPPFGGCHLAREGRLARASALLLMLLNS